MTAIPKGVSKNDGSGLTLKDFDELDAPSYVVSPSSYIYIARYKQKTRTKLAS
jgi:hypothetical protein